MIGPAGLGRELAAVEAAALLVCEESAEPWSRNRCAKRIRDGVHPDVTAVLPTGAARIIKIKQIRKIVDEAPGRPYEGLRRVWILDGVEAGKFGGEAANAFLKVLEEPPEHVVFILLADNPTAVLPTVRSRCQQLALPGAVAVAKMQASGADLPELAAAPLTNERLEELNELIRSALRAGLAGETRQLLRLPHAVPKAVPPLASTAAVAISMAGETEDKTEGEELARLAAELMAVEQRVKALNLNLRGQMVSCLLRWYREL
jgi:DNA polymerase III delta prime subunit